MLDAGIVAEAPVKSSEPVSYFIEISVAGIGDRVLHVLPAVPVRIDPAGRGRLYFVKYIIAVYSIARTDHSFADSCSRCYHLEGGTGSGPLLRCVIQHRSCRIALDHIHVTALRKAVAVIARITYKREYRAVCGIRHDDRAAERIQVQFAGSKTPVFYDASDIVISGSSFPVFNTFPFGFRWIIDALIEQDHAHQFAVCSSGFHEIFADNVAETVVLTGLVQNISGQSIEDIIRIIGVSAYYFCVDPVFRRGVV